MMFFKGYDWWELDIYCATQMSILVDKVSVTIADMYMTW